MFQNGGYDTICFRSKEYAFGGTLTRNEMKTPFPKNKRLKSYLDSDESLPKYRTKVVPVTNVHAALGS